jgi:hypothetical protein
MYVIIPFFVYLIIDYFFHLITANLGNSGKNEVETFI